MVRSTGRRPSHPGLAALLLAAVGLGIPGVADGQDAGRSSGVGDGELVRAVLLYSPTCPHCRVVMEDHLPALLERFAGRLDIATFGTQTDLGATLYAEAVRHYDLPPRRRGVPMLIVGDRVLLGSGEIPGLLPDLVEAGLTGGGVDWPPLPTLRAMVAAAGEIVKEEPPREVERAVEIGASGEAAPEEPEAVSPGARPEPSSPFTRDPVGNVLSVAVLLLILLPAAGSSFLAVVRARARTDPMREWPPWALPVFAAAGLVVSAYLSWTETTGAPLTCGPVGRCEVVQASPYATLLGVVPMALLGLGAYAALVVLWGAGRLGRPEWRPGARAGAWAVAFVGTVFSIYLTALEPFVIGATCAWCLTSAVAMGLALRAATPGAVNLRTTASGTTR